MAGNWGLYVWGSHAWGADPEGPPPIEWTQLCFTGPLTALETSLLEPYTLAITTLQNTEKLRQILLDSAVSTPDPVGAIRNLYMRMYDSEVSTMMRRLMPTPTPVELSSFICYKRTLLSIYADLQQRPLLCGQSLQELQTLKCPDEYVKMFTSYLQLNQPNEVVPVAVLLVFLAKVLETNVPV